MKDSIVIKGNKYGLTLFINDNVEFDKVKEELLTKLNASTKFFNEGNIALAFEGKELDILQKQELVELINDNSNLNIVCIMENDDSTNEAFKLAIDKSMSPSEDLNVGSFHKGTLRSGQLLESDTSIIVIGDVNPGANIVAKGNIVILGSLKGNAYAGANGDENCFVAALKMSPMQIRIADTIARCPDNQEKSKDLEPKIAFLSDNNICIENIY